MRHRVRLHDPIRRVVVGVEPVSGVAAGTALQARTGRRRRSDRALDVGTGCRPPTDRVDHRAADALQNQRSPVPRKPAGVSGVGMWPVCARRIRDEQVLARDHRKRRRKHGLPRRRGSRRCHIVQLASAQIGRRRSGVVDLHVLVRRGSSARHHLRDNQLARRRPRLGRDGVAGQDRCRHDSQRDQERDEDDGDPARRRHSGTSGRLPGGVGAPVLRPAALLRLHCRSPAASLPLIARVCAHPPYIRAGHPSMRPGMAREPVAESGMDYHSDRVVLRPTDA